jgi:hypothetical protein
MAVSGGIANSIRNFFSPQQPVVCRQFELCRGAEMAPCVESRSGDVGATRLEERADVAVYLL